MKTQKPILFAAAVGLLTVAPPFLEAVSGLSAGAAAQAAESIPLSVGSLDATQWGWKWGTNSHKDGIAFTFVGNGLPRELHLTAYDVDARDELSVYLNDGLVGYLPRGPNNGLTAPQVIDLPVAQQVDGANVLEIRQKNPGWIWGVTQIGLFDVPSLKRNLLDPAQWGWRWGTTNNKERVTFTFEGNGLPRELHLTAYDVDSGNELSVYLNDALIGYLAKGPNNGLTAPQVIDLPVAQQVDGANVLEIRQKNPGWIWGVTQIGLFDVASAPPGGSPPGNSDTLINAEVSATGVYCQGIEAINANLPVSSRMGNAEWQWRLANAAWSVKNLGQEVAWFADSANRLCFYAEGFGGDHLYANANVYKIGQVGQGEGLVMAAVGGAAPDQEVPLGATFWEVLRLEPERTYQPTIHDQSDADYWYAARFGVPANVSTPQTVAEAVPTPGAATNGVEDALVSIDLMGSSDLGAPHVVEAYLNGELINPLDAEHDGIWDGIAPHSLRGTVPASVLNPTGDNTLSLKDVSLGTSVVYLDAITVTYRRHFEAKGDALGFQAEDGAPVTVRNFGGSDVRVLDVTEPERPVQVGAVAVEPCQAGLGYCTTFAPEPDRRYLAVRESAAKASEATPDNPTTWWSTDNGAEYLVMAPQALLDGARHLADYRSGQYSTAVVALEDIYDEANYGIPDPEAVRRFIERTRAWSVAPLYYVLVGKMSMDARDRLGYGAFLPAPMVPSPWGLFASVNWYADLEGDDGVPEAAIGLLPVVDSQELIDYVDNKLVPFEQAAGGWRSRSLVLADNPEGRDKAFDLESDEIAGLLTAANCEEDASCVAVVKHPPGGNPVDTRAQAFAALDDGTGYFNYRGHGSLIGLGAEYILGTSHLDQLTNAAHAPVLGAFTCYAGNGTYPGVDSLIDALLLGSANGIVGALGPTGPSENLPAMTMNRAFVRAAFIDGTAPTLGEAVRDALAAMVAEGRAPPFTAATYAAFGDPALRLAP